MKTKVIGVLLVFLLSISITGCSVSKKSISSSNSGSTSSDKSSNLSNSSSANNNKDSGSSGSTSSSNSSDNESENTNTNIDTNTNTNIQISSNSSVLDAYKAVLQNKAEFYSTDNKKNLYLNDFLTNKELYGTILKVTHFTVLDMDGDKSPEVVLELSVGDEPQFYEVLHYMDGVVHGYLIVYRGLENLKADGTFLFSSGAADNGWGKFIFESNSVKTDMLGYSKSSQGDNGLNISYFINNKSVTKEAFDAFFKEQSEKKAAVWYEYSQKNIETKLSTTP